MKNDTIRQIVDAFNGKLFEQRSGDAKSDAQANLEGITHYVDENTLKGFGARILQTVSTDEGLFFALLESLPGDNTGRLFRPVIFDCFGTVCNDRLSRSESFRTSKAANKQMWIDLNKLDASEHYSQVFASKLRRLHATIEDVTKLIEGEQ